MLVRFGDLQVLPEEFKGMVGMSTPQFREDIGMLALGDELTTPVSSPQDRSPINVSRADALAGSIAF